MNLNWGMKKKCKEDHRRRHNIQLYAICDSWFSVKQLEVKQKFQLPIKESREFFCPRTNVWRTFARTTQPVKPVLQTKDTAVCVLQDLKENTVKSVSLWRFNAVKFVVFNNNNNNNNNNNSIFNFLIIIIIIILFNFENTYIIYIFEVRIIKHFTTLRII